MPLVSIIVPTFNRVELLKRAVGSIMSQSFSDFEVIVINDASTDATKLYIDEIAQKDARIIPVHHEKNYYPDISRTLNEGLARARCKYIARLDDDDYWIDSEKLQKQVSFLETHPEYVLVGTGMIVIDKNGNELYRYLKNREDEQIRKKALISNPFSHTTVLFRTDTARRVGGYGQWIFAEDWDLWLKLGEQGKMYNIPEYSAAYLSAGQNKSHKYQKKQTEEMLRLIWLHRKQYPNALYGLMINGIQWVYAQIPEFIRKRIHGKLSVIKRKI